MSGLILTQEVVSVEISFSDDTAYIPFPCVTQAELGETSVERLKTTCFSSPPGSPEYSVGEVDVGEGSITYNMDLANNVHRVLVSNQGKDSFLVRVTINDGTTPYQIERRFLNMGVSEPFNINEIMACTLKVQATGPAERSFV